MDLYEIGKLIGTGSSGDVFLCRHKKQQKFYVVKKIKMLEIEDKERQNIENQLKLLQKLRHVNIVSYKDSFTDKEGNLCIVMIYCQMGDMHNKIKQTKQKGKSFTQAQILDWIAQTVKNFYQNKSLAIHYLHHQKILHRDLKTQNLFLKQGQRVRLGDFGISKVLDTTQDLARTCIGTPYYMAPEIFKYKPYSYKSDIWSLGIIIYQMCNLRLPFQAQHYNALAIKILKGSFPSITPTYSKQLRDLIISILSPKPQNRPTIIDIMNKPFIRPRIQKYMNQMFQRKINLDMDELYLDSLKEQASILGIQVQDQDNIKKYPSAKDLDKRWTRGIMSRRGEQQEESLRQYHSKRKSTFQRESYSTQKGNKNNETNSSSHKVLGLAFDGNQQKDPFVDYKKHQMSQKISMQTMRKFDTKQGPSTFYGRQKSRFRVFEDYSMQEQEQRSDIHPIEEEIIHQQSDEDANELTLTTNLQEQDEEVPQQYNKSYYKLLDQVRVLKHICQTAMGSNKYLRTFNAVNNGCNKEMIIEILGEDMVGYWHLVDQIMFIQSILKTIPKQ